MVRKNKARQACITDACIRSKAETCTAEELVNIPAERWTEDLDSDDDESDLAQAMAECPDPQGSDAVEDDSVEIKCMTWRWWRSTLVNFLVPSCAGNVLFTKVQVSKSSTLVNFCEGNG